MEPTSGSSSTAISDDTRVPFFPRFTPGLAPGIKNVKGCFVWTRVPTSSSSDAQKPADLKHGDESGHLIPKSLGGGPSANGPQRNIVALHSGLNGIAWAAVDGALAACVFKDDPSSWPGDGFRVRVGFDLTFNHGDTRPDQIAVKIESNQAAYCVPDYRLFTNPISDSKGVVDLKPAPFDFGFSAAQLQSNFFACDPVVPGVSPQQCGTSVAFKPYGSCRAIIQPADKFIQPLPPTLCNQPPNTQQTPAWRSALGYDSDNVGHILALKRLKGTNCVFPQSSSLNKDANDPNSYPKFERFVEDHAKAGHTVQIRWTFIYDDPLKIARPTQIKVEVIVDTPPKSGASIAPPVNVGGPGMPHSHAASSPASMSPGAGFNPGAAPPSRIFRIFTFENNDRFQFLVDQQ